MRLTQQKLGRDNPISEQLAQSNSRASDGRARFPHQLRAAAYRLLIETIRENNPQVEIGLCLEEPSMFDTLDMGASIGKCNCVL